MSSWTHIIGSIKVDLFESVDKSVLEKYLNEVITEKLPKVTGSERDMEIYVSISNYTSGSLLGTYTHKYYTQAYLTLSGDFRDRLIEQTSEEFKNFLSELRKWVIVDCISVDLFDDGGYEVEHFGNKDNDEYTDEELDVLFEKMHQFEDKYANENATKAVELLRMARPKTLKKIFDEFPLYHRFDWDFTDDYIETMEGKGVEVPQEYGEE